MLISLLPFFFVLLLPSFIQPANARLVNVTIDDAGLDPTSHEMVAYLPLQAWNSAIFCYNKPCYAEPDTTRVSNGTWHESTFHPKGTGANAFTNVPLNATVHFNGTAVYVYASMAPYVTLGLFPSAVTFLIDGRVVGRFRHSSATAYEYNVLAYENSALPLGSHQLIIQNGEKDGQDSMFMLDRIVYSTTVDDPPPPSSNNPNVTTKSTTLSRPDPTQPSDQTTLSSSSTSSSSPSNSSMTLVPTSSLAPTSNLAPTSSLALTPTPPPTPPPGPISTPGAESIGILNHALSTGNIVGIALGSLAAIILILFIVLFLRRRARLRRIADIHQIARPASFLARSDIRASEPFEGEARVSRLPTGWVVASDSKRDLLSSEVTPPAYT